LLTSFDSESTYIFLVITINNRLPVFRIRISNNCWWLHPIIISCACFLFGFSTSVLDHWNTRILSSIIHTIPKDCKCIHIRIYWASFHYIFNTKWIHLIYFIRFPGKNMAPFHSHATNTIEIPVITNSIYSTGKMVFTGSFSPWCPTSTCSISITCIS